MLIYKPNFVFVCDLPELIGRLENITIYEIYDDIFKCIKKNGIEFNLNSNSEEDCLLKKDLEPKRKLCFTVFNTPYSIFYNPEDVDYDKFIATMYFYQYKYHITYEEFFKELPIRFIIE